MSSPPLNEAPTLRVPGLGIRNALFKSSKKLNKKHLTMDQKQSTLIQLPLEIRTMIWQHVLGGNRIQIVCTNVHIDDGLWWQVSPMLIARYRTRLLQTCRLVYWEAIDELYGCNRFVFSPSSFWAASMKIMPHHFARLRIMDFWKSFGCDDRERWEQLCETISAMTNLRELYMRLYATSKVYEANREKHWSAGLPHFAQKVFHSPRDPDPISENFILDSLYQIKQVRKFKVELDGREKGLAMPEVRSNAPFALICECAEEREARLEKSRQEERERQWIKQQEEQIRRQEEAEKHRLLMVQRETDRLRSEQERKADEIAQSYQSVPGW